MELNPKTVADILRNAHAAKDTYDNIKLDANFRKYFHLRPTSSGITIVSTFSFAPMRGIDVQARELHDTLVRLNSRLKFLVSDNKSTDEKTEVLIKEFGFKKRDKDETVLEEYAQALFIKGMLQKQSEYEGARFVASEFTLEKRNRFDVVGIKDNTLYIFELKKGRTHSAIDQASNYAKLVMANKDVFMSVLATYPNNTVASFDKIKVIAVMEHSENATKTLREKAAANGVDIWYYEPSLHFFKN